MRPRRYALAVELTSHCNQRCGYCYNAWRADNGKQVGALASGDLLPLLERALTEVEFDHVTLTGGEPFARADLFEVLELCRARAVGVVLISNGGLVTNELAARLAPFKVSTVQVTLNGPEAALHDEHVGGDHFAATLRGIEALRRHGVHVSGCVVSTRKNAARTGEILELFRGLGVTLVALSRFSPAGFAADQVAELLPARSDLLQALEHAEEWCAAHGGEVQVTMPVPPCVVDHADYPHVRFGGCPIGTEMQEFALGPRGELRHCTLHASELGDARQTSFAELVTAPQVAAYRDVTPEFCAPCPERQSCIGGCGAAAVANGTAGLDPLVAQHVDDAFAARLARLRRGGGRPLTVVR
ncbi:MAG: radical SAM/SPASM domain-containing protein [Planctomycetota bacterium]